MSKEISCKFDKLFTLCLKTNFNSFAVDKIFKNTHSLLVVGHEDGMVRMYEMPKKAAKLAEVNVEPKPCVSLETKGGPIQSLLVHDVTKLFSNDLIVADSRGMITVLCNEQILVRKQLSEHAICHLDIDVNKGGDFSIVSADAEGGLSAFTPYTDLWNCRLQEIGQAKVREAGPRVTAMLACTLNTPSGSAVNYVLVADDSSRLLFFQHGCPVLNLATPENITAMCSGRFITSDALELDETSSSCSNSCYDTQVVLGTESGAIYVLSNFVIFEEEFANIHLPITQLHSLKVSASRPITDVLLVSGNFNSLFIIYNGKKLLRYELDSWISHVSLGGGTAGKEGGQQEQHVYIGCRNNTIQGLRLKFSYS